MRGKAPSDDEDRKLESAVEQMTRRREYCERTGELPIGRALGMMGMFGWTVVGPTLLGAFLGRWLDRTFHSGIFWSATLVSLGAAAGFYLVWKRMSSES
jgi:ATP synthase protein I